MPYIQCKDGKTYSRYDQSKYVKDCICLEEKERQDKLVACLLDPKCKKEYYHRKEVDKYIVCGFILFIVIGVLVLCRALYLDYKKQLTFNTTIL